MGKQLDMQSAAYSLISTGHLKCICRSGFRYFRKIGSTSQNIKKVKELRSRCVLNSKILTETLEQQKSRSHFYKSNCQFLNANSVPIMLRLIRLLENRQRSQSMVLKALSPELDFHPCESTFYG